MPLADVFKCPQNGANICQPLTENGFAVFSVGLIDCCLDFFTLTYSLSTVIFTD